MKMVWMRGEKSYLRLYEGEINNVHQSREMRGM